MPNSFNSFFSFSIFSIYSSPSGLIGGSIDANIPEITGHDVAELGNEHLGAGRLILSTGLGSGPIGGVRGCDGRGSSKTASAPSGAVCDEDS